MILRPMIPFLFLAGAGALGLAVALLGASGKPRLPGQRRRWALRAGVFAMLLLALVRPSFSGAAAPRLIEKADIILVMDRSGSMSAEDFGGARPRIEGVKAQVSQLAQRSSGAKFSVIGFSSKATVMLPLTDNTEALVNALQSFTLEETLGSRGSSIDAAKPVLKKILQRSKDRNGNERRRFVVYVGDGEQTSEDLVDSFADLRPLVHGGLVLGYGTHDGGPMTQISTLPDPAEEREVIVGPDGEPAVSKINETHLKRIAADLGLTYQHMTPTTDVKRLSGHLRARLGTGGATAGYRETYWVPMAIVALLAAVELGLLSRQRRIMGRRRSRATS